MTKLDQTKVAACSILTALILVGCSTQTPPAITHGSHNSSHAPTSTKTIARKTSLPLTQPVTFFEDTFTNGVQLTLQPDPFVQQHMPNFPPPKTVVHVYLPVYPGAKTTPPNTSIGDMGTPMDADLVDGTVYYKSSASEKKILSWYSTQFQKLGYKSGGEGQMNDHGKTVTTYVDFTKTGVPSGSPTTTPDIDLGFLSQQQNGMTIFKLKAAYIVTPPRPKNTYLPVDITKVVLTNAKKSKTLTDSTWIAKVVKLFNSLQVSTPGMSSGGANSNGTDEAIHATFYEKNGRTTKVTFNLMFDTAKVEHSEVSLKNNITLEKDMTSVLGM